ncbi:S9 family peptidase [Actinomycetospora sp. TBRC 11914]|uniref:alpha/beta hydrolase family protein n=1 Tax=Actinomycetospora sp. TBRC 11914 TaxID=2729387 RepID=UPI00145ED3C4|nr:dipeptidyl aminopeptidase [Actinomycetospora sp. TBRC 11914]NMO89743.1 dipeptidyl aminopeptidase [Actinomycetospora sp. TBRC 11914]
MTTALTVDQLDHRGTTSHEVYTAGFYEGSWDFVVRTLLGKATRGGADIGEVLAAIAPIRPKDDEGWFAAWVALGRRIAAVADDCARRGHRSSASRAYLRAANYYAVAVNAVNGLDGDDQLLPTFRAHRAAWEGFLATTRWPVEAFDIPYEGSTLPGWIFRPDTGGAVRPTLVMNLGSDEAVTGIWSEGAEGALERGYDVVVFEGPGQQSLLFERGVPFRPDWEAVLTPVVDAVLAFPDVDAGRLAVYGVSQAGYWVPRALAFEHRFAAAIADGGVVDVSRSWTAHLPHHLIDLYDKGEKEAFDKELALGMHLPGSKAVRTEWRFRSRPYGVSGYSAVLDEVRRYDLTDVAGRITTPLYVIDADGDQFFGGQPAELAGLVPTATRQRFTQAEGASSHCQPLARELTEQRMLDWLDEQLGHVEA